MIITIQLDANYNRLFTIHAQMKVRRQNKKQFLRKRKVMTMQNARHSILLTLNYKDNSNSDHLGVLIFDRTQEVREEDSEQFQNN